jgi:RNA polymerase sigma-70 factor (ECF subfamily)
VQPLSADEFAPQLYDELRRLAHGHIRRERSGHTLGTTALVHEAWLRMAQAHSLPDSDSTQFLAVASNTMRRVLIDHARRVRSDKRGGGIVREPLEAADHFLTSGQADELVALDDALQRLAAMDERAAQVVVMRFFGGLTEQETAEAMGVSPKTVQRAWVSARAWLRKEVLADLGIEVQI